MKIWVDADACPNVIKNILYRAAERTRVTVTLVANQFLATPPSRYINSIQVSSGFDVADNLIVQKAEADDLVITADIPLAAAIVENGGYALNPRGEFYTEENIHSRLATRDLMEELRSTGAVTGGPSVLDKKDRQAFANALDRFLSH